MNYAYLSGLHCVEANYIILEIYRGIFAANGIPDVVHNKVVNIENIVSTAKVDTAL